MTLPEPVFIGYCPKHLHNPGWDKIGVVCSVSSCISESVSYDEGVPWWTCNRALFYNTVEDARAAGGPQKEEPIRVCDYWLYPVRFDDKGETELLDVSRLFPTNTADLPEGAPRPPWFLLGFDVPAWDSSIDGVDGMWGCSPLSCNGYGLSTDCNDGIHGFPVNEYCLLDSLEMAVKAAKCFQHEQPEPGTYVIVKVEAPTPSLQL